MAPWWALALAASGWLLILAADQRDRVREWGALASTTRIRGLSTGARRIGVLAIALASVVGVVVPISTSSPLRIRRGDDFQSINTRGLYPAGEGAGYAGGIMSAAVDGIEVAEAVALDMVKSGKE